MVQVRLKLIIGFQTAFIELIVNFVLGANDCKLIQETTGIRTGFLDTVGVLSLGFIGHFVVGHVLL